ncbi:amino acid adenylation domain-containing protein [Candidatus Parabeggiatoa sp. HSG14]|uniref:non-ribosomal peptide synthetase n=1 Tax=Candidatus Parabeggiatoa sp. HSG14 TaxID=3055593 RepID=UPI0025A8B6DB|nr:amino acid adenylation domain-containing protein [Thiotrichales bacterium HSG14]
MKTIEEFLSELHSLNIKLWIEDDRLRYRTPKGRLTTELLSQLKARKPEILRFLRHLNKVFSIEPIPEQEYYELSNAQQRLWVLAQLEEGSVAYNVPLYLWLEGQLDREAFEKTLALLIQRHESLRTTFITIDGQPLQKIHDNIDFKVRLKDLTTQENAETVAQQLIYEEALKPFDLEKGPLLKVSLLKLSEKNHVMLFTMHHIISDGWSINVIMGEFTQFYEAFHHRKAVSLPPLRIQYRDYAYWQNQQLESENLVSHRDYWHKKLAGDISVLNLSTDFPRPSLQTFNGNDLAFVLLAEQKNSLLTFCRQQNVSLFMILVAVVKVLLYRYTDQEDIIIGSPIAGRNHADLEEQIGFYVSTLVLRDQINGEQSFETFLQQVKQTAVAAYDHQIYPFDRLVNELNLHRDMSRSPLFDVMVSLQNASGELERSVEGLLMRPVILESKASKLDITFHFKENEKGLFFSIEYNTDLFLEDRIKRMGNHINVLIESILVDAHQPISQLNILTKAEKKQLFYEFNDTVVAYPHEKTLIDLFEIQVEKTPNVVAIQFENQKLTYKALNSRANQLAHYLQNLGVAANGLVGIYVERSLDMLVGLLGILKAGGAYVPLDPIYPQERLAFMLEDSQVSVLLTQEKLGIADWALKINDKVKIVYLDTDWAKINDDNLLSVTNEALPITKPDNLAYVIYTSGSTGKPKGVQITHKSLCNFLISMRQQPGLTAEDVLLAVTTLSFDIAALELYLPLMTGAKIVLASPEVAADGSQLLEQLDKCGVTVMQATPATWRLLLAAGWEGSEQLKILCGGEALPGELALQLLKKSRAVWNMYGPTETTIWSTTYQVQAEAGTLEAVSIGHPIANTQVFILDSTLKPLPIGVQGELHIGGAGLAKGYLNRPELTAEKFINPENLQNFKNLGGLTRLYKTGDLACYLPDGNIEYLGRIDHQIKLRGFRIELGEIEAVLHEYPSVREGVVIIREDTPEDKRLVAYVVYSDKMQQNSPSELRNFLKEKLPDYMLPEVFMPLDALPLTPNGKVNRKALPVPEQTRPELEIIYTPPRNEMEQKIISVWQTVLNVEKVGIYDNFFELGGHSLKATKVISKMQRDMGINVKLLDIFRQPTVAELAELAKDRDQSVYAEIKPLEASLLENKPSQDSVMTAEELEMLLED